MTKEAQPRMRRAAEPAGIVPGADRGNPGCPEAGWARTGRELPERTVAARSKMGKGLEPVAVFRQDWDG